MKHNRNNGFTIIEVLVVFAVLVLISFVGYYVYQRNSQDQPPKDIISMQYTDWQWTGDKWKTASKAPQCPSQPMLESPTDLMKATSVLYPGQTRGEYKPHGGLRFDNNTDNKVAVTIPMDAYLISGSRYIQEGEQQVLLNFLAPCGIAYRFDHLKTLAPKFAELINKLPPAKPNDSRTTNINPLAVRAGELVADEVGFTNPPNVVFDFGVYDLRQANGSGKIGEQAAYGVCWLKGWLPDNNSKLLLSLPGGDANAGKSSDYCR